MQDYDLKLNSTRKGLGQDNDKLLISFNQKEGTKTMKTTRHMNVHNESPVGPAK